MISRAEGTAEIGLGTAQLGDLGGGIAEDEAHLLLQSAVDLDISYFDTAPLYGAGVAERRLGAFLQSSPREAWVSTKVGRVIDVEGRAASDGVTEGEWHWDYSSDGVRRSFEESQGRLQGHPVSLLLAHDPQYDLEAALSTGLPELERLRSDGIVPAIGIGSGDLEAIRTCLTRSEPDFVLVAGRLTLLEHEEGDRLVRKCAARNIRVIVGGVFNSGILATSDRKAGRYEYGPAPASVIDRANRLARAARSVDVELPAAALHFALRHRMVAAVLLGAENAAQLRQNLELIARPVDLPALWRSLSDEDLLAADLVEQLTPPPTST